MQYLNIIREKLQSGFIFSVANAKSLKINCEMYEIYENFLAFIFSVANAKSLKINCEMYEIFENISLDQTKFKHNRSEHTF